MLFNLVGCSWLVQPPVDQLPARQLIEAAAETNAGLSQYKGLGQVQLVANGQSTKGRIALAAVAPDRMRVEWLSPIGQPLTSLAGDGRHITILVHADGKKYRLSQTPTALERMVHIPIGIEGLLSILAGRPPLPKYAAAQIDSTLQEGDWVVLKNRWRSVLATLQMDRASGRIKTLKKFDGEGAMQYEVQWRAWKLQGQYAIPKEIFIRSFSEQTLTLIIDRFWPDADVAPDTFVLTIPDDKT